MALSEIHPRSDLLRYLDGDIAADEKSALEEHLASCESCRNYLAYVRDFNNALGELTGEEFTSTESHPDSWTLVAYEVGQVDDETARHVRAHLLFCDSCQEEFLALHRLSEQDSWRKLIEQLKDFVIDLWETYGEGILIGPVRIASEHPALAARGTRILTSKVLEIPVGDNRYSIELTFTEASLLSCDIAPFRRPAPTPLHVSLRSESGEEITSTDSDDDGKCHFDTSSPLQSGVLYVLSLNLGDVEQHIAFRNTKGIA